eukprot:Gb_01019 [translate_table: standard]
MALPFGKLAIVVGAGIAGSVLAKEGRITDVSDFFSGAFKVVLKHLKKDESSSKETSNDNSLMAQVNSLRQELQLLASSRSITVVTGNSQSGTTTYAVPVIVIGVAGYGYIWWKGWKLSDMMFATRRSLSDACTSVSKQLEQVSTSIAAAKRHLSSRIDQVDNNLNECAELNAATKDEVYQLRGDLKNVGFDVESVQRAVQGLEFKIGRIEGKQDVTNQGVYHLCEFVQKLEQRKQSELIQVTSSSKPALEYSMPTSGPSSGQQASSSSPRLAIEQPPSGSGSSSSVKGPSSSPRALEQRMGASRSGSGLKEVQGISEAVKASTPHTSDPTVGEDELKGNSTNSSMFGWKLPGLNPAFLQRSRSATGSFNKGISPRT